MRVVWKGAVSFGLVSIAVKLYPATEEKAIRFHQIHAGDGGRIRYKRTCTTCGEEVSYEDIAKGYDLGDGEIVVLTDEDFAELPLPTGRVIDVLEFVPAEQVDPILYDRAYYVEPEGNAIKPYVLLRDALARTDRVAIVKVALRQREHLATLRVRDDVVLLNTMLWPDEVRPAQFGFLDESVEARPAELAMAASLIGSMATDFDPTRYTDNYRAALQEVIDAKVAGDEVAASEAEPAAPSAAMDLMAALRASVDKARAARGHHPGYGVPPAGSASEGPASKAPRRPTAKKTAGKRPEASTKTASGGKGAARKADEATPPEPKKKADRSTSKKSKKTTARSPAARTLA